MDFSKVEIEAAIRSIDDNPEQIIGRRSVAYNLLYRSEIYPPILVLSIANQLKGLPEISFTDFKSADEAFQIFKRAGDEFIIRPKMEPDFSYVDFFKELSEALLQYRDRQSELVQILRDIGNTKNLDDKSDKGYFPLNVMDPFTFFAFFTKIRRPEERRLLFRKLKRILSLKTPSPDGFDGVPTAQAIKLWYFPYQEKRDQKDIETLWDLAEQALHGTINPDTFQRALAIKAVGLPKLTQGLFNLAPDKFYPVVAGEEYLSEAGIDTNVRTIGDYESLLSSLQKRFQKPYYEISADAWKYRNAIKEDLAANNDLIEDNNLIQDNMDDNAISRELNRILFGPPGTGKTYHTVTEAIKITSPKFFEANKRDRSKLQNHFNDLLIKDWTKTEGQIAFCTFHQSFSYEDFVEGIKPLPPSPGDSFVKYDIIAGVFKNVCRLADASNNVQNLAKKQLVSFTQDEFTNAVFYKISLGDSTKAEDAEIYEHCINNDCISVGFGDGINFSGKDEGGVNDLVMENNLDPYTAQVINYFKNYLQQGHYVVVSNGNSYIRAIGKVVGEYTFDPNSGIGYDHFRKVEWIFKDVEIPVDQFYQKNLSQQTIYKLKKELIKPEFFVHAASSPIELKEPKNFVIIIDEINRGNVSSIFGELITLIEGSKRAGEPEALETVLPYSKQRFTVPKNVYIIGTMNTADRSIESLDTALRRRFSFKEMFPDSGILRKESASKGQVEGVDLALMLDKINVRIEKLVDRDHRIGHSYFMSAMTKDDLRNIFKDKIIPLLEEYFFGDLGKIGLVLGSDFVAKVDKEFQFASFKEIDTHVQQELKEKAVFKIRPVEDWKFENIYKN